MLTNEEKRSLDELCKRFRIDVLGVLHARQTGHPGGSLSVCEILTSLYFKQVHVDPNNPKMPDRDRVVLCKGHAAPMLYRVLAEKGFLPIEEMKTLRDINTRLQGHPCSLATPGVDLSTGPLGIGLSAALGMALGLKLNQSDARVYAILGDGELDEGTVWEACMCAAKYQADNLCAIVDRNGVQLDGTVEDIMPTGDLRAKFTSFGWHCIDCDGHNVSDLCRAYAEAEDIKNKPTVILAHTIKGKGVPFMEGKNEWHGRPIGDEEFRLAMVELEGVE